MSSFIYVGTKPEHIVGIPAGDISEPAFEALPWELQQAVYNNRGSDGNPLYQERPSRAERKRVRDLMGPDPDSVEDPEDSATDSESAADPVAFIIPDASQPIEPAPPDVPAPAAEEGGTA